MLRGKRLASSNVVSIILVICQFARTYALFSDAVKKELSL